MSFNKVKDGLVRTMIAVPLLALALGENKDPGYLYDAMTDLPVLDNVPVVQGTMESVGSFLANHQNPTVAFLGLSAVAIAVNRGPLLTLSLTSLRDRIRGSVFLGSTKYSKNTRVKVGGASLKVSNSQVGTLQPMDTKDIFNQEQPQGDTSIQRISNATSDGLAKLVMDGTYTDYVKGIK